MTTAAAAAAAAREELFSTWRVRQILQGYQRSLKGQNVQFKLKEIQV
jgi:hypothetical protein